MTARPRRCPHHHTHINMKSTERIKITINCIILYASKCKNRLLSFRLTIKMHESKVVRPVTGQSVPCTCQNVPVCFCKNVPVLLVKRSPWVKTSHQPKRSTSMVKTSHVVIAIQNARIQNVPASLVKTSFRAILLLNRNHCCCPKATVLFYLFLNWFRIQSDWNWICLSLLLRYIVLKSFISSRIEIWIC